MKRVSTYNRERYLKKIRSYIARMPSLSTTTIKVLETCNNPRASANDLKQVISLDPVLTARVLKLINSAYYSLGVPITSLTRAIVMLGLNTVKNLALSFAILNNLKSKETNSVFSANEFWTHSLCVGVIAKNISAVKAVSPLKSEAYFVAGLLHDLGKIPLNRQFPKEYCRVWETARKDNDRLHHSENKLLGLDHGMVGCLIANKWRLGATLVETLSLHHDPESCSEVERDFVLIVSLANQFANHLSIGNAGDGFIDNKLIDHLTTKIGVDQTMLHGLGETVLSEIEKAKIFLDIAQSD